MATYPDFTAKTDNVDIVHAADVNELQTELERVARGAMHGYYTNIESITANKTLTDADMFFQSLTPNAARDVTLPAVASTNHSYVISNGSGSYALTVKNAGGTTIVSCAASSRVLCWSDGASWYGAQLANSITSSSSLPKGYLHGLTLSNNAGDATNDIDIALGMCRDSTNAADISLTSALTGKQLDAAWAVGASAGFLDQGSIANATYHVHLIKRSDTGVVDAIASLAHDRSDTCTMTIASPAVVTMGSASKGHGLVAGAPIKFSTTGALPTGVTAGTQYYVISAGLTETAFQFSTSNGGAAVNTSGSQSGTHTCLPGPKMPTSYDYYRRIGSIVRSGAAILAFTQDGDNFYWKTHIVDQNGISPAGTSAVTVTLTVPTGVVVNALMAVYHSYVSAESYLLLSPLAITDQTPSISAFTLRATAALPLNITSLGVMTDRSAGIRRRVSATGGAYYINTMGWVDTRGRVIS